MTTRSSRWRRLAAVISVLAPFAVVPAAAASTVDVSLQVEMPGHSPPTLAFTGFPMLLLLALLATLVAVGGLLLSAGRERVESQRGKGN